MIIYIQDHIQNMVYEIQNTKLKFNSKLAMVSYMLRVAPDNNIAQTTSET